MIKKAISDLTQNKDLSFRVVKKVFEDIFSLQINPAQVASFLIALKMKGETEVEIAAAAFVIRKKAIKLNLKNKNLPIMDTCGTGGSGVNKFNISTAVAFVVSASGVRVAKHGNRAMSSNCGSADVLEELGIKISLKPCIMKRAISKVGIGFLYAPLYHPALGKVAQIRRDLGVRTIFNILGPLCNPALADHQLLGVFKPELTLSLARVLKKLGLKKALVVNSKDLGDEVSLSGPTKACFLSNKKIKSFTLNPTSFGLKKISLKDLSVPSVKSSAKAIKDILDGKKGPKRDIVLANASACFYVLGKVKNFKAGAKLASQLIDKGAAAHKYIEFKEFLEKNA